MDAERLRAYLLALPHLVETMQWGANLVFWTGDKAIGGKMFALINLDEPTPQRKGAPSMRAYRMGGIAESHQQPAARKPHPLISYAAGPSRYSELLEIEGLIPAPYMARIHWVAALGWDVFTPDQWRRELSAAHALTLAKLPQRTRAALALPAAQQKRLIAASRKLLAARKSR